MNYFPKPYLGESYYSILARYQDHSGAHRKEMIDICGNELFNYFIPSKISVIGKKASSVIELDAEGLLHNHTLFPWLSTFLTKVEGDLLKEQMLNQAGKKKLNVLSRRHKKFLFCPICAGEDRVVHGETYWHIDHIIPFASICIKHNCFLLSPNRVETFYTWSKPVSAESLVPFTYKPEFCNDSKTIEFTRRLISINKYVSCNIQSYFVKQLYEISALYDNNGVREFNRRFIIDFYKFFDERTIESCGIRQAKHNTLHALFKNERLIHNMDMVIALLQYLEIRKEDNSFGFKTDKKNETDLVYCVNSICPVFKQPLKEDYILRHERVIIGHCPDCEMIYFLTVRSAVPKVIKGGLKLSVFISQKMGLGERPNTIMDSLNYSHSKFKSLLKNLDIPCINSVSIDKYYRIRTARRNVLLNAGTNESKIIWQRYGKDLKWLRRHDHLWLRNFLTSTDKTIAIDESTQLDELILKAISESFNSLIANDVNYMITRNILKCSSIYTDIMSIESMRKFPKSHAFLMNNYEDTMRFIIRRIRRCITDFGIHSSELKHLVSSIKVNALYKIKLRQKLVELGADNSIVFSI